jgi:two-component system chemotaxis sensor kinase CheA
MSSNGPFADGLRRQVEELAMTFVMQESPAAPDALRALASALEETRRQAAEAGWEEVAQIAGELAGAQSGAPDLEHTLRQGIARLQAAVESGPPGAGSAGNSNGALAQDADLLNDIVMESSEHLSSVETQLLTLEQDPANAEAIHSTFRSFHTIKGLAGFMELTAIQEVAHEVESVLDLARNKKLRMTPAVIDVVLAGKDYLQHAFRLLEPALRGGQPGRAPDNAPLIARIRALAENPEKASPAQPDAAPEGREDSVAAAQRQGSEARMVKVDTAKLDFMVDMAGEMVIAQSQVTHDPDLKAIESPRLQRNLAQLARITEELQKTAMSMRMVPVGQLFRRMHRLVRDLARKAGKQVELELAGEDTELDRTIVEALSDPLIHMVRNSVDHGIERPDVRRAAGKDPTGRVRLKACHQAGSILIEICDDGRGIDREKVLAKARDRGLISPRIRLTTKSST